MLIWGGGQVRGQREGGLWFSGYSGTATSSALLPGRRGGRGDSRHSAGASSLLSRQSLSPSHFQRSWIQRLLAQANSPGWHCGGGT